MSGQSQDHETLRERAFARMVERGLEDVENGRTISHEEMKKRIFSWSGVPGK